MPNYRKHLAQFKRDMDNPPPAITPEQAANDWAAGYNQDFPAVFDAQDRARAKAYASEPGLALTLEYISRLEEIARASLVLLKHDMLYVDPVAEPKRSAVYNALRAVDLLDM